MKRRRVTAVVLVSLVIAACAGADETPVSDLGDATPGGATRGTAEMIDFGYRVPEPLRAGQELTVVNSGDLPHTFTIGAEDIDTGIVSAGRETTITLPDQPGTYEVVCTLHRIQMRTSIEVS